MSAIDDLTEALGAIAVRPVTQGKEETQRWLSDLEAYTRARMGNVRPLSDRLRPLVERAMDEWRESERGFFGKQSRKEFVRWAAESMELGRKTLDIVLFGERNAQNHTVRNIAWVDAFAWILPCADPQNAPDYRSVGQAMAAIMWCEAMLKWPDAVAQYRFLFSLAAKG
jgi:hypothetical protein